MKKEVKIILAFAAGAAIGIGLGILFSSGKGSETRRKHNKFKKNMTKELNKKFEEKAEEREEKLKI